MRRRTVETRSTEFGDWLDNPCGNFTADGHWYVAREVVEHSRVWQTVRVLVGTRRKHLDLLPRDLAEAVRAAVCPRAFPNVDQWARTDNWLAAWATTAAERTVQTGGRVFVQNPTGIIHERPEVVEMLKRVMPEPEVAPLASEEQEAAR